MDIDGYAIVHSTNANNYLGEGYHSISIHSSVDPTPSHHSGYQEADVVVEVDEIVVVMVVVR